MAIPQVSWQGGRGRIVLSGLILAGAIGLRPFAAWGQAPPPDPTPVAPGESPDQGGDAPAQGGQVLTRGAVHEAFAAPVVHDPKAAPVIAKAPPEPIQEMPPDQKPAGQNIRWIPGYWSWDDTRNDYIWVSGVWREPPPNSQWVPGYWNQVQGGCQWVPGTWVPVSTGPQSQATYLPPPPPSLEQGPSSPSPGPNVAWTPGFWSWGPTGYVWRPGFWAAVQPNWIWMPAHYVWTPSGFLFVPGYWDLPVASRGLMFAPVYYPQPVYAQPGFVFTPSISIVGSAVTSNLFVQAGSGRYLFGDFYAQNFVSVGITPWFSFSFVSGRPAYYDPLFSYYAVVNVQQNPRWVTQVREAYVLRRDNVAMRPPHTYIEQTRVIERNVSITRDITVVDHRTIAMPLHKLAADPIAGKNLRLVRVAEAERHEMRQQAAQLHQVREQRLQQEREVARAGVSSRPRTMSLPHSPIASHPMAHPAGSHAEVAHRPEMGHPGGPHPAAAHRPEAQRGLSREMSPAREGHPGPVAAGPQRAWPQRPAPGGGGNAHRAAPGAEPPRGSARPGMNHPAPRESTRSAPAQRGRERTRAEEEAARREPKS